MDIVLDRVASKSFTLGITREIERQVESYFAELLTVEQETNKDLTTTLKVSVNVGKESWTANNTVTLESTVDLVYRSDSGWPIFLNQVLEKVVSEYSIASELSFYGYPVVEFGFNAVQDDLNTLFIEISHEGNGRKVSETGLIAATSILAVILIAVSSVLLYITGGWDALLQVMTNCLFEEIEDDDNYLAHSKSTFRVHSTDDGEDESDSYHADEGGGAYNMEEESLDEGSAMTGPLVTPRGTLGAIPATKGLGIKTPNHSVSSSYSYTPDGSAITDMTDNPMGIASIRKMPQNGSSAVAGGLSHLIMKRLNSSNKKSHNM